MGTTCENKRRQYETERETVGKDKENAESQEKNVLNTRQASTDRKEDSEGYKQNETEVKNVTDQANSSWWSKKWPAFCERE